MSQTNPQEPAAPVEPAPRGCKWDRGPSGIGPITRQSVIPAEMVQSLALAGRQSAVWQCPLVALADSPYCCFHSLLMGTGDQEAQRVNCTYLMKAFAHGYFFGARLDDGALIPPAWYGVRFN